MRTLEWVRLAFCNPAKRTYISSSFVDNSCMMGDKNGMIQTDGIIGLNLGNISATSKAKDISGNKFNEIIGMIILESIVNGFKIINFNIESSYDIIIDRQTPPFMYELNVKHILT